MSSTKHTAVIVEPRVLDRIPALLEHFHTRLGSDWKIVFYCGKGLKSQWGLSISSEIEIRELDGLTMTPVEYNDFFKRRDFWTSLDGEYILVFQVDSWIANQEPLTIDYFINMNHSYIGAHMGYMWYSIMRERLLESSKLRNYCGGLSLRKRTDMIRIIDAFPPEQTWPIPSESPRHTTDPEDSYFLVSCYKLNLTVGDDGPCTQFAIHSYPSPRFFGVYRPDLPVQMEISQIYPDANKIAYLE